MSRSIEQKRNLDGFVKPGELINIRRDAELSLQDRRVFNLLIEHAWPDLGEERTHKIALSRLRGLHKGAERVVDSVRTLMTTLVEVPVTLDGEPAMFATQLLGPTTRTVDEDSPNAVLLYSFPKELRRIIRDSHYWGRIKAHVMFAFSSKYALALYEAVCLRANLKISEQTFSVDDFRAILAVEEKRYPGFPQLKQKVLAPAIEEINALSDFNIEVEPLREGGQQRGRLVGFRLRWERKSREEWTSVLDELIRPKIGRKARIRGRVQQIEILRLAQR